MKQDITIRPYCAEDTVRLGHIWLEASLRCHAFFPPDTLRAQQRVVCELYLPHSEIWVAEAGGQIVGFIGLIDRLVGGLFVCPEAQGVGVGRQLMRHALALKGSLELEVYTLNTGAVGFYRHMGFHEESRRPTDDQGYEFELIRMTSSD